MRKSTVKLTVSGQVRDLFAALDENGDGLLDREELEKAVEVSRGGP